MAVTYEQARETVRGATESGWTHGTYCLDDRRIVENDDIWVFQVGAREFLVDGDDSFAIAGSVAVVLKDTGELQWWPSPMIGMDASIVTRDNPSPTVQP